MVFSREKRKLVVHDDTKNHIGLCLPPLLTGVPIKLIKIEKKTVRNEFVIGCDVCRFLGYIFSINLSIQNSLCEVQNTWYHILDKRTVVQHDHPLGNMHLVRFVPCSKKQK